MQIRTEAGLRLHIEPPLDCSEDFESPKDVTGKAKDATVDHTQVGTSLKLGAPIKLGPGAVLFPTPTLTVIIPTTSHTLKKMCGEGWGDNT